MNRQTAPKKVPFKPVLVGFAVGIVIFVVFVGVVMLTGGK